MVKKYIASKRRVSYNHKNKSLKLCTRFRFCVKAIVVDILQTARENVSVGWFSW